MNKDRREPEYPTELESQFILRLPDEPAKALRELLKSGDNMKNRLSIQLDGDMRNGEVCFDQWMMHGKIFDLPTIVESLKTIDNKSFYKTADICQMMICKTEPDQQHNEEESPTKNKKKDPLKVDKKFLWPHGVTPPTKNVRKRRFRKTLKKKYVEAPEIEKEVKRLLRADNEAVSVSWEVIQDEDDPGGHSIQTIVEPSPAPPPKPGKKHKERSHKKATATSSTVKTPKQSSNVVDIFGGAVSDSDAEDDHVNVEMVEGQTPSHGGRKSKTKAQNLSNRRKSKNPPASADPHVFQPPKPQARTKKSRSRDQPSTSVAPDQPSTSGARDQPSTSAARDQPSTSGARDQSSTSGARDQPSTSAARDQPSTSGARDQPSTSGARDKPPTSRARDKKSVSKTRDKPSGSKTRDRATTSKARNRPSTSTALNRPSTSEAQNQPSTSGMQNQPSTSGMQNQPSTSGMQNQPSTSRAIEPIPSTSGLCRSTAMSSDDDDYVSRDMTTDFENMTLRIEHVRTELEELKQRRQRTQHEIAGMENLALRQRFQDILHTLNQDIMFKEMEYQGMITYQTSEDI